MDKNELSEYQVQFVSTKIYKQQSKFVIESSQL